MNALHVLAVLLLAALGPAAAQQPEGECDLCARAAVCPPNSLGARPQTCRLRRLGVQAPPPLPGIPPRSPRTQRRCFRPPGPPPAFAADLLLSLPEACAENWAAATAGLTGAPWAAGSPPCGGSGAQPWLGVTCNEQGQVVKL